MSDNRKYYYLKLKENFYNSETMVILESMQGWPSSRRISMKSCRIWRNMKGRSRLSYPLPQA